MKTPKTKTKRIKYMNTATIVFNFFSAFIIAAGTAAGCVFIGGAPTKWQIVGCVVAGLVVASKDTRSLLKLPSVDQSSFETSRVSENKSTGTVVTETSKTVIATPTEPPKTP